jgi:hypothetical protein
MMFVFLNLFQFSAAKLHIPFQEKEQKPTKEVKNRAKCQFLTSFLCDDR